MEYYDEINKGYDSLHFQEQAEKARLVKENCRLNGLVLDVGAGTGSATRLFEGRETTLIALDPAREMLKHYSGMKVVARAEELPFKDAAFDSIISLTALHHADLQKAKSEIERVAKPEAGVAISFFKRAKNFQEAKALFSGMREIGSEKDTIFIRPAPGTRQTDSEKSTTFIRQGPAQVQTGPGKDVSFLK